MVKDSSITISHAPIGGHFNSVVELSTAYKTIFKVFEKKANLAFYFQNFMVYRKGKSNCHPQVNLIVADQVNNKGRIMGQTNFYSSSSVSIQSKSRSASGKSK